MLFDIAFLAVIFGLRLAQGFVFAHQKETVFLALLLQVYRLQLLCHHFVDPDQLFVLYLIHLKVQFL